MASPASRKRNTARMDGNAAYDLRSTAAEEYLYSTAPVDLPHAPRPTETVVPESAPRPKQATFASFMGTDVQLSQASAQVSALEDQYAQLQEQQTRLRIDYESAFNLTEIEDYAIHELGMQKPRSDQLYYISSSNAADTAVVLDQTAAEPLSLADRFGDFLTSIVEYFR